MKFQTNDRRWRQVKIVLDHYNIRPGDDYTVDIGRGYSCGRRGTILSDKALIEFKKLSSENLVRIFK